MFTFFTMNLNRLIRAISFVAAVAPLCMMLGLSVHGVWWRFGLLQGCALAYVLNLLLVTRGRLFHLVLGCWYYTQSDMCSWAEPDNCVMPWQVPLLLLWRIPTAWFRTLPNVWILGVQKGGTTSLHRYLCGVPGVSGGICKECHVFDGRSVLASFFDDVPHVRKRLLRAFFPFYTSGGSLIVEATPVITFNPWLIPHILETAPLQAKFVVLLRDPIERAFSSYNMQRRPCSLESSCNVWPASQKQVEGSMPPRSSPRSSI